jgi:hypothetical protein
MNRPEVEVWWEEGKFPETGGYLVYPISSQALGCRSDGYQLKGRFQVTSISDRQLDGRRPGSTCRIFCTLKSLLTAS